VDKGIIPFVRYFISFSIFVSLFSISIHTASEKNNDNIFSVSLIFSPIPAVADTPDCGCGDLISGKKNDYTAHFSGSDIVTASPGDLVGVTAIAETDTAPCCDAGDPWNDACVMNLGFTRGQGWEPYLNQASSGCRSQKFYIPVPVRNSDSTNVTAIYRHGKAGGFTIRTIPFRNPNDPRSEDMDPVNIFTGALRMGEEDYRNSDIEFSRYYNQLFLSRGYFADSTERWKNPIGVGWQHNYNIYIREIQEIFVLDTVNACKVYEGNKSYLFVEDSAGNFHSRRGNHMHLKKSGSIYTLYKSNGLIYSFNNTHHVDTICDRNGRITTFSYSGNYLTSVTGKDQHTLNFSYNSDSLLQEISITENSKTKKILYRYYNPIVYVPPSDSDTFYLFGSYFLTKVLQYYDTGGADSLISLYKYYYDENNFNMVAKIIPHNEYTQLDTVWKGNYKKGDRLYLWYNTRGQVKYMEIIDGDGDTLISNDKVTYKAFTEYHQRTGLEQIPGMDSALTYIYQGDAGVDSAHNPYDTTFTPQAPTSNYAVRKRDYHNNVFGRTLLIETRPDTLSNFTEQYYRNSDFNDTLTITPDYDSTKYTYQSYVLYNDTFCSPLPTKIIYPNGDSILNYYHAPDANAPSFFLLDSTFDELGRKTIYKYDSSCNLDSIIYDSRYVAGVGTTSIITDYTYNNMGNLTQIKDARGNSTYFSYAPNDTGCYLTQTRIDMSPSGTGNEDIVTKYKYNTDIGKVDTSIYFRDYPGDSSITRYTYDVMNRQKEIYYPDGTKDVFTYDKRGNLLRKETETTGEESQTKFKIEYEYDAMDHLTKVKEYSNDPEGEEPWSFYDSTLYAYNLNGELISFKNANDTTGTSTEVKYKYDAGRLIKVEYPDTTYDSLRYYSDGNLKFKLDRKGQVDSLVYDSRNRLTKKYFFDDTTQYPNNPQDSIIYTYDAIGNMIRMVDMNDTINYSYDEMDNLDTLDCYQSVLISYEYDKNGNKKKLKAVNYSTTDTVYLEQSFPSYDEANRLDRTVVGPDTFEFTYWDDGQIKKIEYPNGIKEQYKLTSRNFIDIVTDSSATAQLFKYDYKYNEVGDRDTMIFKVSKTGMGSPITGTVSYKYDDLRRITEAQYPASIHNKTNIYTYDRVGNRLKKIAGTDTTEYSYNKRNNQLTAEGVLRSYVYDDNGNLIKLNYGSGSDTLFYDYENRTTKFVDRAMSIPPTKDTIWYHYCGMGKRIKKIEKPNGSSPDTTQYAYDGMYAVCEFGGHLDLEYKYIYANGLLLARYDKSPGDTHYYHHDGLGSIVGLTNESAIVEQSYFYDEFGNSLGSWGSVNNHYLYTGQEYDGSISELYNLRARLYDMGIGRFTSEDPVWQSNVLTHKMAISLGQCFYVQDIDPYPYVSNNPLNLIDPTGEFSDKYGNWCGKDWSGGKPKVMEDFHEKEPMAPPIDPLDACCLAHDWCYYRCRKLYPPKTYKRLMCYRGCDRFLLLCWSVSPAMTPYGVAYSAVGYNILGLYVLVSAPYF
jgi:RHS repeat-associated protein